MHEPARYRVGAFDLAIISDGFIKLDAGAVNGLIPKVLWEPALGKENIDELNRMRMGLNCMVVRRGGDVLIVETGMGDKHGPQVREKIFPGDYGYLMGALAKLDLRPEDVTAVANTHLHADHSGWNTVRKGSEVVPAFPNARYFAQAGEYEAAMHPNERTKATYFAENFEPVMRSGQLELVTGEVEVIPGVHFMATPGHTADHASLVLSSNGETAIYTGDLVHHATQIERAAWISAFDILPLVTLESKKRFAERAIRENALIICAHESFPGAGRLVEDDGRRRFIRE
ncbi:MAG: MBL fold metallo-hydrolase [Chloroflexi bacterium]|nr:MBL fold metallo-hydrolase [Chloroflexota bacterium]